MSLAGRMANVIAAPSEAFDAVKNSPPSAANWVAPALLLILISWIGTAIVFSQPAINQQMTEITEAAVRKQLEKSTLPPDQAERTRQRMESMALVIPKIGAAVLPVFAGFLSPFIWGLFVWLLGAKAFAGGFTYMKAVEAVGLANVILALEALVRTLLILFLNNVYATPSLALLVLNSFDQQNTVHVLLNAANVMTFWLLAARSAGLARLAGVSFPKAAACVFGIWLAYTGFFVALGAAAKALMSGLKGS
jgi:hypothetical protein